MKKYFKSKKIKKNKLKKIIIIIIVMIFSFISTTKILFNTLLENNQNNEIIINNLLETLILGDDITDEIFNINFSDPKNILQHSLDFIISFSDKDDEEPDTGSYVEDPNPTTIKEPVVYIYSTHQSETYASLTLNDYNIEPNIMMASYLLREKLNDIGVPTIVETTNLTQILKDNNWLYSRSYEVSRDYIKNAINTYPTIKLIIDLHRDSASKSVTTLEIEGKNYARTLFVVGKEHENYQVNLDLANKFNDLFKNYNENFSRGIYLKEGPGVNGIYNQDLNDNIVLLELGGQYNTIDEVNNSVKVIANIIKEMIENEKEETL